MHESHLKPDLVPVDPDDPQLKSLYEQEDVIRFMSETRAYGVPMPTVLSFRIVLEGKTIGEASLRSLRWFNRKAEVSVYILPQYRFRKFGGSALRELIETAFGILDLHRLEAEVYDYNTNSLNLAKKMGFREEGRLREAKFIDGRYHDIIRLGLLRHEYTPPAV